MSQKTRRIEPLDALRGFAAVGFALGVWFSLAGMGEARIVANLGLLADFILVIAGFIVARAHREQLSDTRRVGRYLFARFGRHFPLHAGCLAIILLMDATARHFAGAAPAGDAPSFLSSLLLLHIFFEGANVWNAAAWVVAAEMWMSLAFGLMCVAGAFDVAARRILVFVAVCALIAARLVYGDAMPYAADMILRGATAFTMGALLQAFVAHRGVTIGLRKLKKRAGTTLELWGAASILAFIALAPAELAPIAPLVFAQCLLIFLRLKCGVSKALDRRAPQKLGQLSYAIILSHILVAAPIVAVGATLSASELQAVATLGAPMFLVLTLVLAETAHRLFDRPTRAAMSEWAQRVFPERPEYDYEEGAEDDAARIALVVGDEHPASPAVAAESLIAAEAHREEGRDLDAPPREPPLPLPTR